MVSNVRLLSARLRSVPCVTQRLYGADHTIQAHVAPESKGILAHSQMLPESRIQTSCIIFSVQPPLLRAGVANEIRGIGVGRGSLLRRRTRMILLKPNIYM